MTPTIVPLLTATDFAALPLADRTRVFADWLRAQPREATYNYNDHYGCALSQFAQALYRSSAALGFSNTISTPRFESAITVFKSQDELGFWTSTPISRALAYGSMDAPSKDGDECFSVAESISFGAASDAFDAAMKLEGSIP